MPGEDLELAAAAIEQGADVNALWDDQTLLSATVFGGPRLLIAGEKEAQLCLAVAGLAAVLEQALG